MYLLAMPPAFATGVVNTGPRAVDTADTWRPAARFTYRYAPSLGDAFALGTAAQLDGTLIAGWDGDFDAITEVPVERVGPTD